MPLAHMQLGSEAEKCYLALNLPSQMLRLFLYGGLPLLQIVVPLNSLKHLKYQRISCHQLYFG